MKFVSIICTLILLTILIIYLIIASRRKTLKNIYSLITNIITFIGAYIVTRIRVNYFSNNMSNEISKQLLAALNINPDEWLRTDSITAFTKFLTSLALGLLTFFFAFLILFIINHLLKRLIFRLIQKEPYNTYESKNPDNKIVNALIGLVSFIIVTFAYAYPAGTIINIINSGIKKVDLSVSNDTKFFLNNPVMKLYTNNFSVFFFDSVTSFKNEDDIKTSEEIKSFTTILLAANEMNEDDNKADKDIRLIKEELQRTYLISNFISDVVSNAATNWKNNEPFMGEKLELPNDSSRPLYLEVLNIMSNWQRDNLIEDLNVIFNLYDLLDEYNLLDKPNSKTLLNTLGEDKFTEELFLNLFTCEDFKTLLPEVINFGINGLLEQANITSNHEYIDISNLNNMTTEEIKNESHIFSLTIRQVLQLSELKNQKLSKEDYNQILNNLNKIKDSKIFNNILYNTLYILLQSKT